MTLLVGSLGAGARAAVQKTLHVSPTGDDANPGTPERPFKTITKARDVLRGLSGERTGDLVVILHGGTYTIDQTIVFDNRDSGTKDHPVIYKAPEGEAPVISGGKRITGWEPDAGGKRWKAKTDLSNFRQLYVNGIRAVRAQGPPPKGIALHGEDGYTTTQVEMADWRNPADIELCYYVVWCHTRCRVAKVVREGDHVVISMLQPWFSMARKKEGVHIELPSYVENALELLDEPGEWYLDRAEHTVYYIPRHGEDMKQAEVIAPAVERLIELKGTLDRPVQHIRFEGITFTHAGWLRPSEIGHVDVQANFILRTDDKKLLRDDGWTAIHNEHIKSPSNLVCRATKSVVFERCTFTQLGSGGIDLEYGAQDNVVNGCHFFDISGTAVQVGDVLLDDHHPDDPRKIVRGNQVTNNTIHDVCVEYKGGVGVFAGYTEATRIAHNHIHHLPYSGISMGWGWGEEDAGGGADRYYQPFRYDTPTPAKDNRIEFNHIHHVMQHRDDGGGIYTLGIQPGTIIRGNHIHDARGGPGGIYLDEGSGFIEVTGNVVYGVGNPLNFNNRVQNRLATCKVHGNHVDGIPSADRLAPGKVGKALRCDGKQSCQAVPHSPDLEPERMTIEAWVRMEEIPTGKEPRRWIVNKNTHEFTESHYALMIDGDKAGAYLNIGGGQENCHEAWSAPNALRAGHWHHLAMSYDGKVLKVYLDGRAVASKEINKKRVPGETPLYIGRRVDGHVTFNGLIDEVRFYNRALSDEQIHLRFGGQAVEDGLVACWSFDEAPAVEPAVRAIIDKAGPEPPYRKK